MLTDIGFFDVMKQAEFTSDTMAQSIKPIRKFQKLKTSQLKQTIATVREAMELEKNQNWNDYFDKFNLPKREQRQSIMKLLYHGISDLGTVFKDKCYTEYQKLAQNVIVRFLLIYRE